MKTRGWRLTAGLPLLIVGSGAALSQTEFHCPKPGTVVEISGGKRLYADVDPGDPVVCRGAVGSGAQGDQSGFRLLYNWYGISNGSGADTQVGRQSLADLFSGRRNEVIIDIDTPGPVGEASLKAYQSHPLHDNWQGLARPADWHFPKPNLPDL